MIYISRQLACNLEKYFITSFLFIYRILRFWRFGGFTTGQCAAVPTGVRYLRPVLHNVRSRRHRRLAQPDAAQVHDHEHRGRE